MRKLLVTGAGGFIGSHVVEAALEAGHQVKAFVRYNSKNHWGWLEQSSIKNDIEVISGDIRDFDSVSEACRGCDTIVHLAALIGIPYSYVSPLAYLKTNIEGTYNVLQAARQQDLREVIVTSTSETYGTAQTVPISELHPLVGQSPYSASKISADQLAISYHRSFGLPVKIVRPFNTYGPRQSARAIIPTIITQIIEGNKILKLGNLSPTRDLTFVKDTAAAFLAVLQESSLVGEVVNVGTGREISVRDLAEKIAEIMGVNVKIVEDRERVRPSASEVDRLLCDASKLKTRTLWRPQFDLDQGLQDTVAFLKKSIHLYKANFYNV